MGAYFMVVNHSLRERISPLSDFTEGSNISAKEGGLLMGHLAKLTMAHIAFGTWARGTIEIISDGDPRHDGIEDEYRDVTDRAIKTLTGRGWTWP